MKKIVIITATLCLISSCSVNRSFKAPGITTEKIFGEEVNIDDSLSFVPSWRDMFTDESLQLLIEKGVASNTDLQIARLNIEQAEALLRASKLAFFPSLSIAPQGTIAKFDNNAAAFAYNLPLVTQWELDLSGKLRNSKEQALASMLQSQEYVKMVQTQLISAIANYYYTLIMLDEQLKTTYDFVLNQKENLGVIIALKEAGMQTETAVNQATAEYYNTQSSARDLEKQIKNVENALSLLVNQTPHTIGRSSMNEIEELPISHHDVIPLVALSNRPDVKEAEYALRRNFYGVNVARSAFYPSITLSGSIGWTNNIGNIVNPGSMLLSALGALTQPLFSRGVNQANLKVANAQYEQSLLSFEKSLLVAGNEVNNALIACQNSAAKKMLREKQVEANAMALENSSEQMKHSSITYLEVLIAQGSLLQSKLMQVSDWFEGVQGQINLYKALGGGAQ